MKITSYFDKSATPVTSLALVDNLGSTRLCQILVSSDSVAAKIRSESISTNQS
jgi:hypothetical protein